MTEGRRHAELLRYCLPAGSRQGYGRGRASRVGLAQPDRFRVGLRGSGPADLALNILLAATGDRDFAAQHHQEFKWRFVISRPRSGGTIPATSGRDWITPKGAEP